MKRFFRNFIPLKMNFSGTVRKSVAAAAVLAAAVLCGCGMAFQKSGRQGLPADTAGAGIPAGLKAGDRLAFGAWEQDNDPDNGPEPIEWQVLAVEDGRALLLSEYALEARPYNETYRNVTWGGCTLRAWLNGEFFNTAFSSPEQARVSEVKNKNPKNPYAGTRGGSPTKDRVFLLDLAEADKYFTDDASRQCEATAYAKARGAYVADDGNSWWWLRSPGSIGRTASIVLYGGYAAGTGYSVADPSNTVRPALWLSVGF